MFTSKCSDLSVQKRMMQIWKKKTIWHIFQLPCEHWNILIQCFQKQPHQWRDSVSLWVQQEAVAAPFITGLSLKMPRNYRFERPHYICITDKSPAPDFSFFFFPSSGIEWVYSFTIANTFVLKELFLKLCNHSFLADQLVFFFNFFLRNHNSIPPRVPPETYETCF